MLSFLKAPANAPLITDKHEVDARYRYWRRHILITIWLGYALFYFTRKSFNAAAIGCICLMAMVAVMEERKIRREKKIQQVNIA
ncbi:hypothetical protein GAV95_16605 [Salmonella enterica subsp. enterica serovar Enteritidis]|nr:hypothetical protein [Salmonella enterica subsp. enterica serovar Enteritidis]